MSEPVHDVPASNMPVEKIAANSRFARIMASLRGHIKAISGLIAFAASIGLVLKGLLGYVDTYKVAASIVAPTETYAIPKSVPRLSIVVLPFTNLSNDPEEDFFADGLTDDLTTDLSHLQGSFIISRNTAFTFRGKTPNIKQIGRDLGVRYVLEGSVRRAESKVIVNARLLEADTGGQIWGDRLEGDRTRLGELQVEFISRLSRSHDVQLTQAESLRSFRERPNNPDASDLAMRGWASLNKPRIASNSADARKYFEQAVLIDSTSYQANLGLARALAQQYLIKSSPNPIQDLNRSDELVEELLLRDPSNAMAHFVKGEILRGKKDFDQSLVQSRIAQDLDPNLSADYAQSGITSLYAGRAEDLFAFTEKAIRLSPRDPVMSSWDYFICHANSHLARWELSLEWCNKSVGYAKYWAVYVDLASANAWLGNKAAAKDAVDQLLILMPGYTVKKWAGADWSQNPTFLSEYARITEGLRKAGLPEN